MKKVCKIRGLEVEVNCLPIERKLMSTGEIVTTGRQWFCSEKVACKENCLLRNKKDGNVPFDEMICEL